MELTYDKEADAAYIYVDESSKDTKADKTIELNENIIIDLSENGKLIGIEVLSASKILGEKALLNAKTI